MHKICIETINLGFSIFTIYHNVYKVNDSYGRTLIQTIGHGRHDIGMLPSTLVVRLYDYPFYLFPRHIYRDANNPIPNPIDDFLLFEQIIDIE